MTHVHHSRMAAEGCGQLQGLKEDFTRLSQPGHTGAFLLRDKGQAENKNLAPTPALAFQNFLGALSGEKRLAG